MATTLKDFLARDRGAACNVNLTLNRAQLEIVMEALEIELVRADLLPDEAARKPYRDDPERVEELSDLYWNLDAIRKWRPTPTRLGDMTPVIRARPTRTMFAERARAAFESMGKDI